MLEYVIADRKIFTSDASHPGKYTSCDWLNDRAATPSMSFLFYTLQWGTSTGNSRGRDGARTFTVQVHVPRKYKVPVFHETFTVQHGLVTGATFGGTSTAPKSRTRFIYSQTGTVTAPDPALVSPGALCPGTSGSTINLVPAGP